MPFGAGDICRVNNDAQKPNAMIVHRFTKGMRVVVKKEDYSVDFIGEVTGTSWPYVLVKSDVDGAEYSVIRQYVNKLLTLKLA